MEKRNTIIIALTQNTRELITGVKLEIYKQLELDFYAPIYKQKRSDEKKENEKKECVMPELNEKLYLLFGYIDEVVMPTNRAP